MLSGHPLVDDVGLNRLLHQSLAALARPLATNVAMYEEFSRHNVQLLAHIFANAHHGLAAIAGGVLWFVVVLHTSQMFGQCLAFGLTRRRFASRLARRTGFALQGIELRLKTCLIGRQRLFEQLPLLGVHALGLGTEAPGLQAGQLKRDALDLDVTKLDGLRLRGDELALLADVLQQRGRNFSQCTGAQTLQVLGFEFVHVEHAPIVQNKRSNRH